MTHYPDRPETLTLASELATLRAEVERLRGEQVKTLAKLSDCYAHSTELVTSATVARMERDAAEAELHKAVCVWCGHIGTRDNIAEHVYECIKSPLGELARTWTAEKDALRARLEALEAAAQNYLDHHTEPMANALRAALPQQAQGEGE